VPRWGETPFFALKDHGMPAQGNAVNTPVRYGLNVAVPLPNPVIKRGIDFFVAELARRFGFPCKNGGAESPGDFRYS